MAKRGGSRGGRKFVRDAIGRFARTGAEALGRVAKEAMKEGEKELTAIARQAASDAVKAADAEWREARKAYRSARRSGSLDEEEFADVQKEYKAAVKKRAAAKAKLGEIERN